jgi:hypothetical protein
MSISWPETGLEEINGNLLEADWPETGFWEARLIGTDKSASRQKLPTHEKRVYQDLRSFLASLLLPCAFI